MIRFAGSSIENPFTGERLVSGTPSARRGS